eukprot:gene16667-22922_t
MSYEPSVSSVEPAANEVAPSVAETIAIPFPDSVPSPTSFVTRSHRGKGRGNTDPGAMLLGASITLGLSLIPRLARGIFRGNKRNTVRGTHESMRTPEAKRGVNIHAFGSPVNPGTPTLSKSLDAALDPIPELDVKKDDKKDQETMSLPPGQIKLQLQMLEDMEAENAKLRGFVEAYMKDSEKVQALEKENNALKMLKEKLEGELTDVQTKFSAVANNGDELSRFKLATQMPLEARSVYSDIDVTHRKDNYRVDSSASMAGAPPRKTGMQAIMKWASTTTRSTHSTAPSPATSPRNSSPPGDAPNVVGLFDMFAGGGRY